MGVTPIQGWDDMYRGGCLGLRAVHSTPGYHMLGLQPWR